MRVTLIRHGIAGEAPRDDERALTPKGRIETRRVARTLDRRGIRFDCIVSSPLVRAVQTAEIVAAATQYRGTVLVDRALSPASPPSGVVTLLQSLGGARRVALCAHEPILSLLAAVLIGQPRFRALEKSEALRIRLPDGPGKPGTARWRVDPLSGKLRRKADG